MSVGTIELESVGKTFRSSTGTLRALSGMSLRVERGERVALVGRTGSGKTTALSLMLGLREPTEGTVRVLGIDPFREFGALAGRTSVVFQQDRLLPWLTALQNAAFGLAMLRRPLEEQYSTAQEWLGRLGLGGFEASHPHELSGGMRQRVAIARAMSIRPEVLFADEAFSSLDELTAESVREDLVEVLEETGTTTVFVTHSIREAVRVAHRVLVIARPGRILGEVDVAAAGGLPAAEQAVRGLLADAQSEPGASEEERDAAPRRPGR
jgi:NitT/TauT family transport system ATP-binding protein